MGCSGGSHLYPMSYTPPPGDRVGLQFDGATYTSPPGDRVGLEFSRTFAGGAEQYVFPHPWNPPAVGDATVQLNRRYLSPTPTIASEYGNASLRHQYRFVTPSGIYPQLAFGTASIRNWNLQAWPPGFVATQAGQPKIENLTRYLSAGGLPPRLAVGHATIFNADRYYRLSGFNASAFGSVFLQGGVVTVNVPPIAPPASGEPWVSRSPRELLPSSIFREFPTQHTVGGTRWINPEGWEATLWGSRIIPESQSVFPQGFGNEFGAAKVWNYVTRVNAAGLAATLEDRRFGRAYAWNLRQYVFVANDQTDGLAPPPQGGWTEIYNRNRIIAHHSTAPSALPRPLVILAAHQIVAQGIEAPGWDVGYKAGMVAYRVRHFPIDGIEAPHFGGWSSVHNGARVLRASGWASFSDSIPTVVNTRRWVQGVIGFESSLFGYAMVSDRVREISIEPRYSIEPPYINLPDVKLHTRYVDAIGSDMMGAGPPDLVVRWSIIYPKWTLTHHFGIPGLVNVTPEVRTHGNNNEDFGGASVRLEWRPVNVHSWLSELFGGARIADRTARIEVPGLNATTVSQRHEVTKTGAPPYTLQRIVLERFYEEIGAPLLDGYGIGLPVPPYPYGVPTPRVSQNIIYVRQDSASDRFGAAKVEANTIRVVPGIQEINTGIPWVSGKIRRVTVERFPDNQVYEPSRVRISPHTIYSVVEAPPLAKANHPVGTDQMHYVNSDRGDRAPGEVFGAATVRNRNQQIIVLSAGVLSGYGAASLTMRKRYVSPMGIQAYRFGWHTIPGDQTLEQFASPDASVFGGADVRHGPYLGPQDVTPIGFSGAFGLTAVELFDRELSAKGFDSLSAGSLRPNDRPYMWQGLRVGPHVPTSIGGGDQSAYGEQRISLRIRELQASGFDSFRSEYDIGDFSRRMRVRRPPAIRPPRKAVSVAGGDMASVSAPAAGLMRHYIRPDGNADQHRKGAPS